MTSDRIDALERRMDALQTEHSQHQTMLDSIAENVCAILRQMNVMAASLASHTTTEADHHAARSKMMSRIFISIAAIVALLTAIYSVITGTSIQSALFPMLKSLFGL